MCRGPKYEHVKIDFANRCISAGPKSRPGSFLNDYSPACRDSIIIHRHVVIPFSCPALRCMTYAGYSSNLIDAQLDEDEAGFMIPTFHV